MKQNTEVQTKYVVASIGRSGSTLIADLIDQATGSQHAYTQDIVNSNLQTKKTHAHFIKDLENHKTIFMFADIYDVITSLYLERIPLLEHFNHLEIKKSDIRIFRFLYKINKNLGFIYLILGDKFRFIENIESWKKSSQVIFVNYESLCENKDFEIERISNFLGIKLPDFKVKQRVSKPDILPKLIKIAIKNTYEQYYKEFVNNYKKSNFV